MKKILFICTGNAYRSRFSEALFNFLAEKRSLFWCAFSRGAACLEKEKALSSRAAEALMKRNISLTYTDSFRNPLKEEDLTSADMIVALDREEHYPLLLGSFPHWANKIEYWNIEDHDPENFEQPDPLLKAELKIEKLIESIIRSDNRKETVAVLGASPQKNRYSWKAVELLKKQNYRVIPIHPTAETIQTLTAVPNINMIKEKVDTLTIYINPLHLKAQLTSILNLRPSRVIFNPGTECPEAEKILSNAGIEVVKACTLVLLHTNQF